MYSFWRPGGPIRAVRSGGVADVKSAKVGPLARRSWSEDFRRVGVGSGVGGGAAALANERGDKNVGRGVEKGEEWRQQNLADLVAIAYDENIRWNPLWGGGRREEGGGRRRK